MGTNLEYARRIELGYIGRDSLGRNYNQPARSYLRRAYIERLEPAVEALAQALKDLIAKNV